MSKRKRFGGRKKWRRSLSEWDRSRSGGHSGGKTCNGRTCGVMAEHKHRMRMRQALLRGEIGMYASESGSWGSCEPDDPRAVRMRGWRKDQIRRHG